MESKLGEGTRVWARFPLGEPEEAEEDGEEESVRAADAPLSLDVWKTVGLDGEMGESSVTLEPVTFGGRRPRLLVVEDNSNLRALLCRILEPLYEVIPAADGQEGLERACKAEPDLILSDVMMPRLSGLQLLKKIRELPGLNRVPVVLLTAKAEGQDRVRGLWSGANDYLSKPFIPQELLARIHNLLRIRQFETYLSLLNTELAGRGETLEDRLRRLFVNTVRTLVAAIDSKDYYTGGHSDRVAYFSGVLGKAMGLDTGMLQTLQLGALLHDVGKIGIPDHVLNKIEGLNTEEIAIIRQHVTNGGRILETAPELSELRLIAVHHHERWDGKGYPNGLVAEEIPLLARIVNMADTWDAMVSDRVYRPGMEPARARELILRGSGTQFDPRLVKVLNEAWQELVPPPELRPLNDQFHPQQNRPPVVGRVDGVPVPS